MRGDNNKKLGDIIRKLMANPKLSKRLRIDAKFVKKSNK